MFKCNPNTHQFHYISLFISHLNHVINKMKLYFMMAVVMTIVVSLIIKFLKDCDDRVRREAAEVEQESETIRETNRLLPNLKDSNSDTYGTMEADDLESGNSSSSSDELYDGKICIICYDQHRNCFFVPCGHSAACYGCAQRYHTFEPFWTTCLIFLIRN